MTLSLKFALVPVLALGALAPMPAMAEPFRLILTHLEPPLVPNSVMDLAVELGYFEREGVEVELIHVQQTPSALAAIQANEGEMANIGVDALLQLVGQGVDDLKAVTSPNKSLPFLIAARDEFATAQDLAGARFGVGRPGSLDHSLSMNVLSSAGLDTDTLEVLSLGQPNVRAQALAAQQVDATTMSIGVWLTMPERDGLSILVDQDDYYAAAPVINKVNIVPQAVIDTRREDVVAVLRALVRISRDFSENPALWAEAMEPLVTVSRQELDELSLAFAGTWSVNGGMNAEELVYTQEWLLETEDFQGVEKADLALWTDLTLIDDVLAELGVDATGDAPGR